MGKYSRSSTQPPKPAKYGTEFSETNRFGQSDPAQAAKQSGYPSPASRSAGNSGSTAETDWSGANLLELIGAVLVLCLVARVDAGNGGKGFLNPSVLFLFWVALATFVVRAF